MDDDTTDVPTAPPPPEERAFSAVLNLLSAVTDAEAVKNRLEQLRTAESATAKAQRQLNRSRIEAVAEATKAKEELEAERKELAAREKELMQREVQVEAMLEALRRGPSPDARLRHFPGGMTAEPDDEPPSRARDPHFGRQSVTAADEGMVVEKVGPSTGTLTRSVPRKSTRRGTEA
jgi:hypothetical protein